MKYVSAEKIILDLHFKGAEVAKRPITLQSCFESSYTDLKLTFVFLNKISAEVCSLYFLFEQS